MTSTAIVRGRSGLRAGVLTLMAAAAITGVSACGSTAGASNGGGSTSSGPVTLRIGYLANLTHAPALIGVHDGFFTKALGKNVTLKTQVFNAGPDVVNAMFGGALDMAYMGPGPAINGYLKSHGEALRIIAGAALDGAGLVVRPAAGINSPADLRGKRIATPQLGNTQDVALRVYLAQHGMHTNPQGGGDVNIINAANSTILTLFQQGQIDAAWVPEPYETRLIDEDGGKLFVDEATLWPQNRFVTTDLVASESFLQAHPDVVKKFLTASVTTVNWINSHTSQAQLDTDYALLALSGGKTIARNILQTAWQHIQFTVDPDAASMKEEAQHIEQAGFSTTTDIKGIFDLGPLNQVLRQDGQPAVSDAGLGG